jgi:hypothetical protein
MWGPSSDYDGVARQPYHEALASRGFRNRPRSSAVPRATSLAGCGKMPNGLVSPHERARGGGSALLGRQQSSDRANSSKPRHNHLAREIADTTATDM